MKPIQIYIREDFYPPEKMGKITPIEWETWIMALCNLLTTHDEISQNALEGEMSDVISKKYVGLIESMTKSNEDANQTIRRLQAVITEKDEIFAKQKEQLHVKLFQEMSDEKQQIINQHTKTVLELENELSTQRTALLNKYTVDILEKDNQISKQTEKYHALKNDSYEEMYKMKMTLREQHLTQLDEKENQSRLDKERIIEQHRNDLSRQLELFKSEQNKHRLEMQQEHLAQLEQLRIEYDNRSSLSYAEHKKRFDQEREQLKKQVGQENEQLIISLKHENDRLKEDFDYLKDKFTTDTKQQSNVRDAMTAEYTKQLQTLSKHRDDIVESFEKEKLQISKHYDEKIKSLMEHSETTIVERTQTLTQMIEMQKEQIEQLNDSLQDRIVQNDLIDNINNTLKPIVRFYSSKSAEEKGSTGEKFIYNILTTDDKYSDAQVEDTSGQAKHGDLYFKWKQMRCMIEIKNKITITRADIEKFERDVDVCRSSSQSINCALFISLQTDIFPNKPRSLIQFDYYQNTLIAYLYMSSINDVHYAIGCLDKLLVSIVANDEQTGRLIKHFTSYYEFVNKTKVQYEKQLLLKNKEVNQLTKRIHEVDNVIRSISSDYMVFIKGQNADYESSESGDEPPITTATRQPVKKTMKPVPTTATQTKPLTMTAIKTAIDEAINDYKISTPIYKIDQEFLAKALSIDLAIINRIKNFDNILDRYLETFLMSIIDLPTASKVMNHDDLKKRNSKFPSRPYVVKNKIISDLDIRRVSLLSGAQNAFSTICNYCEKVCLAEKSDAPECEAKI